MAFLSDNICAECGTSLAEGEGYPAGVIMLCIPCAQKFGLLEPPKPTYNYTVTPDEHGTPCPECKSTGVCPHKLAHYVMLVYKPERDYIPYSI